MAPRSICSGVCWASPMPEPIIVGEQDPILVQVEDGLETNDVRRMAITPPVPGGSRIIYLDSGVQVIIVRDYRVRDGETP